MVFNWKKPFQCLKKEIICENSSYNNSHIPNAIKCGHFIEKNTAEWNKEMGINYSEFLYEKNKRKYAHGFKNRIIRLLKLKGSWKWAVNQMLIGKIIKCNHWSGSLKLKIDNAKNTLLQSTHSKEYPYKWETANYFLDYELFTDYVVIHS